jgi:pimeloyl-ACP methyl ester carboxylesterase
MRRNSSRGVSPVVARVLVSGLAALALVLAGCTAPQQPIQSAPPVDAKVPADIAAYYHQALHWKPCHHEECTTVSVPLDWSDPSGAKIALAIVKRSATDGHALGDILYDPGGPGASAVYYVEHNPSGVIDKKLTTAYNLVGFDSRGVGSSTAITCLNQAQLSHYLYDNLPGPIGSASWVAADMNVQATFDKACEKNTGALLGHMDTVSAARDLDVLRAALGQKELDYFGTSYGTKLGLEYASMFPKNVGRFVLDGIDDPSLTGEQFLLGQVVSVEDSLERYLSWCLRQTDGTCPFTGTVAEADAQLTVMLDKADAHPMVDSDGRKLNGYNLGYTVIDALYTPYYWPSLSDALRAAALGSPDLAFQLSDDGNERRPDGTYPNIAEAYEANICDDFTIPDTPSTMAAEAATINKVAPVLGPFLGYQGAPCAAWPYPPTGKPVTVTAKGTGPILLVSSTHDLATPLPWAQNVAKHLANGHLIIRNGDGHGSYLDGNSCIDRAVDSYFLHGRVPKAGAKC